MMNRVKFDTQSAAHGEDIPLVNAAKTVFDSSKPSMWTICASISPPLLWPFIRMLSRIFPGKTMTKSQKAFQTLYDASDALIQVRSPSGRSFHCISCRTRHTALSICCRPATCTAVCDCIQCIVGCFGVDAAAGHEAQSLCQAHHNIMPVTTFTPAKHFPLNQPM